MLCGGIPCAGGIDAPQGDWFPGELATEERIAKVSSAGVPAGVDLRALLRETHAALKREEKPETGH